MKLLDPKTIIISTLFVIPALSLQAQNLAQNNPLESTSPDIYVKAEAGASYLQDLQVNVGSHEQLKFDIGTRFDLVVGYNFTRSWSAELDLGVIWNSIDKYGSYSFSGKSADLYQFPVMLNYVYRLPIKGRLEGFLGGGIGLVVGALHVNDSGLNFNGSDVTFGGQAMAGLNYHLSNQVDLSLAYKFVGTTSHEWTDGDWYTKTDGTLTHAVLLGVSIKYY